MAFHSSLPTRRSRLRHHTLHPLFYRMFHHTHLLHQLFSRQHPSSAESAPDPEVQYQRGSSHNAVGRNHSVLHQHGNWQQIYKNQHQYPGSYFIPGGWRGDCSCVYITNQLNRGFLVSFIVAFMTSAITYFVVLLITGNSVVKEFINLIKSKFGHR